MWFFKGKACRPCHKLCGCTDNSQAEAGRDVDASPSPGLHLHRRHTLGCHVASLISSWWRKVGRLATLLQRWCTQYVVWQVDALLKAGMIFMSSFSVALCSRFIARADANHCRVHHRMGRQRIGSVGMPKRRKQQPKPAAINEKDPTPVASEPPPPPEPVAASPPAPAPPAPVPEREPETVQKKRMGRPPATWFQIEEKKLRKM